MFPRVFAERLNQQESLSNTAVVAEAGPYAPTVTQWVVFRCGTRRFGFPLERVSEIITPRSFSRLPGTGPQVCGLVGFRGRVITVFDLGVVLGLGAAASSVPDHRLLLLELGARRVGAAVDEVVSIAPARLSAARDEASDLDELAVLGTGTAEDGAFVALDPELLLKSLLQN